MTSSSRHYRPNFVQIAVVLILTIAATQASADCDPAVAGMKTSHLGGLTLCQLQSRYNSALEKLSEMGIEKPKHVGNAFAPRFINMPDWTGYLAKNGDSDLAAWKVYNPSPKTWGNWLQTAEVIDSPRTSQVFLHGTPQDVLNWLEHLHSGAMNNLLMDYQVGTFRQLPEIIPLHFKDNAYTLEQIQRIEETPFHSFRNQAKLMSYAPRICDDLGNAGAKLQVADAVTLDKASFKVHADDANEPVKACGDLTMAPTDEVPEQMLAWAAYVHDGLARMSSNPSSVDVIELASSAQQWMVVVHPFVDGNGRMSRFMMDVVLESLHLPPPTLDDMNQDFFSTPQEWADLVGKGMMNTVTALEACARDNNGLGCQVVADSFSNPK